MVTRRDDEKKKGKVEKENFVIFLSIYFIFFYFRRTSAQRNFDYKFPLCLRMFCLSRNFPEKRGVELKT